jgi:glycosyltransferase involved in cell wall biosynthesis
MTLPRATLESQLSAAYLALESLGRERSKLLDQITRLETDVTAHCDALAKQLGVAEKAAQGLRAAYEALIEPLIGATTKLAHTEAEREVLSARLAETTALLAATEADRAAVAGQLAGVLQSSSWRLTRPLRQSVTLLRRIASRAKRASTLLRTMPRRGLAVLAGRLKRAIAFGNSAGRSLAAIVAMLARLLLRRTGGATLSTLIQVFGWWRLHFGRPRTMWGVTPILTLPLLARCDRLLGFRSESLVFTTYYTSASFDISLKRVSEAVYRKLPRWANAFQSLVLRVALLRYDVFHLFCDRGLMPPTRRLEINPDEMQTMRRYGRRLYTYTYGADVRTRAATLSLGRFNICAECPEPGRFCTCDDEEGAGNIARIREHATGMLAMGDMLSYVSGARNLNYWPIDLTLFPDAVTNWCGDRPLRVAHAPNHAHFKGTHYLTNAVERLKSEGYAIELVRVQGVPNSEVLTLFSRCDLVADQFIAGFHGYTAFEAMALGKPVLCYLRARDTVLDPENCPIINTWPDNIYGILKSCLQGEWDLTELGRRSRSYIARYHSLEAVAARLGRLYIDTASFPARINRRLGSRVSELESALPPVIPGPPPVPWDQVELIDDRACQAPFLESLRSA